LSRIDSRNLAVAVRSNFGSVASTDRKNRSSVTRWIELCLKIGW
jgi:hypothetical protein